MYLEKYDLKGRVAIVTGGGQGIGLACAQALGEAGATVVVAEMQPERVESATAELKGLGINAVGMALDVTKSAQVDEIAARVERELGPAHILVNNAGVAKSDVRAEDTSDEHWRFHMDVNLGGQDHAGEFHPQDLGGQGGGDPPLCTHGPCGPPHERGDRNGGEDHPPPPG